MAANQPRARVRRPWKAVTALLIVLVLVIAGIAILLIGRGRHSPESAGSRTQQPGRASGSAVSPSPSAGSSGNGQSLPTRLAGLRWVDFYGVELPVSPSAGPWDLAGGLARGFADTPAGALLAALNIGVRANAQWGPRIYGPTVGDQVTGPGASTLLAECQSSYQRAARSAGVMSGRPLGRAYVSEEAFRWVSYSPAGATVDIVSAGPGGQGVTVRAVTRIQVVWVRGDWRVIAPPGGDWGNSAAPVRSLRGYHRFRNPPA
jgi:hypothetical protein